jgi:hypothetical protein
MSPPLHLGERGQGVRDPTHNGAVIVQLLCLKFMFARAKLPSTAIALHSDKTLGAHSRRNPSPPPLSPKGRGIFLLVALNAPDALLPI